MPVFEKSREIVQAIKFRKIFIFYIGRMPALRKIIKCQTENDASYHQLWEHRCQVTTSLNITFFAYKICYHIFSSFLIILPSSPFRLSFSYTLSLLLQRNTNIRSKRSCGGGGQVGKLTMTHTSHMETTIMRSKTYE